MYSRNIIGELAMSDMQTELITFLFVLFLSSFLDTLAVVLLILILAAMLR